MAQQYILTAAPVPTTDPRLSDARVPTAHAASHASGGSDPISDLLLINEVSAAYTLKLTDSGLRVAVNKATNTVITVPLNSLIAHPIGTVIELQQVNTGQFTITPEGGVLIRSPENQVKSRVQWSAGVLHKRAVNEWTLNGELV